MNHVPVLDPLSKDGKFIHNGRIINRKDDHAGFWKCPYHNSRMCLEIMERNFEFLYEKMK